MSTPEFRDIRSDLKLRLEGISARRDEAQRRYERELKEIEGEESILREMLKIEDKSNSNGHPTSLLDMMPSPQLRVGAQNRIEHEILIFLSDGKEHAHSEIRERLLGIGIGAPDDPNFGRSVQGTLLSMRGRDLVTLSDERTWKITQKGLTGD
jgi:hypothetical protein